MKANDHHDPSDNTVTHFIASKNKRGGFVITLYRFRLVRPSYGQTECNCTKELVARGSICHYCISKKIGMRPEYKGPMGWSFHTKQSDPDVIKELRPIEDLPAVTGDNLVDRIFDTRNMYSG